MASANFINECKKYAYENRYGKLEFSNPALELNQSNKIQSFSIDSGCYDNGNIVGSVYVSKLNAQLIDALNDTIENRQFDASVGVKYSDDSTEYISIGTYVVEKPKDEQTTNFSSFIAYDLLMQHLEEKYSTQLDYEHNTITIADVYDELCTNLGLTPVTTTFTNSTITVEGNPFTNGETNRTVLQSIAKVACAFVDIDDETNEIDLKWLSDTLDYTFEMSDYSTIEGAKTVYGPVNSLIIRNSIVETENVSYDDPQSIALNGEHQLVISEDYFLYNQSKRQAALMNIWNKVNGLTYTECTLISLTGKPFLKKGNKIRVYIDNNNYIDSYILQHEFTYDGTYKSVIKCPVLTEQQVQTKQANSLGDKVKRTEIIVNKQGQSIEQIVSAVGNNGEVTSASIVTAINNDTSQITLNADKISLEGYTTINNGFAVDNNGNVEMSGATINNGTIDVTSGSFNSRTQIGENTLGLEVSDIDTPNDIVKIAPSGISVDADGTNARCFISNEKINLGIRNGLDYAIELDGSTGDIYLNGKRMFESGTWTPTLENATVTYTTQVGIYRKIGDLIYVAWKLQGTITAVTSPTYAYINGLPYSAGMEQSGSLYEYGNCFYQNNASIPRLVRVTGSKLGIQDGSVAGVSISKWEAGHGTFYISGSATYIKSSS